MTRKHLIKPLILSGVLAALALVALVTEAGAATKYAKNGTLNWSSANSWSATGSGGLDNAGAPTASDDVIFDSGYTGAGSILTVDTTSCVAKTVTANTGATGTLNLGTGIISVNGNVTFVQGFHLTGTGLLRFNAAGNYNPGGLAFPGKLSNSGYTVSITDNATVQQLSIILGTFNITAGKTLTVTGSLAAGIASYSSVNSLLYNPIIKSSVAASPAYLVYQGTQANLALMGATFTDIDASGSSVPIYSYQSAGITRSTNIYPLVVPPVAYSVINNSFIKGVKQ